MQRYNFSDKIIKVILNVKVQTWLTLNCALVTIFPQNVFATVFTLDYIFTTSVLFTTSWLTYVLITIITVEYVLVTVINLDHVLVTFFTLDYGFSILCSWLCVGWLYWLQSLLLTLYWLTVLVTIITLDSVLATFFIVPWCDLQYYVTVTRH